MDVIHQRCAGLDVHKDEVVACARVVSGRKVVRTSARFPTTTRGLGLLSEWLSTQQATRPPWSWTLPAMLVQDALTAPNAFTFVAARDFVSASGLGTEATLSGLLRRRQLPRHV